MYKGNQQIVIKGDKDVQDHSPLDLEHSKLSTSLKV